LHKAPLDAIGRGYGVDWPREWSRDEKFGDERDRDPYCKKVSVAGRYRDADGEWKTLPPLEKEIDLREGSAEVVQIRANQEYKETKDLPPDATPQAREQRLRIARRKADTEIAQLRKFIGMHARTKARLAVIRTIVRGSYTLPELQAGPFRIFRVIKNFKAPADRPDLQAKIDDAAVQRLMGSSEMLYGATISQRALPPVSDDDSPPPEDAGVVVDIEPQQTGGSEPTNPKIEPESPAKQCTPQKCYGADPAALHVNACYGTVTETKPAEEEKPVWKITRGSARGLAVDDRRVTPETLLDLRKYFITELDPNGPDFASLSDERKDLLSGEMREVVQELRRRGIKDDGSH
jgi:hypothetical protein